MESTESMAAQTEQAAEEKETALKNSHERIRTLVGEGKLAEAILACNAVLADDASNADNLFLKALVLYLIGDHRRAEPLVIEALDANSFSAEYYTLLSGIYQRKGALEEANLVADRGLAVQPAHVPTLQVKALALIRLFRLQDAQSVLHKIQRVRQEPGFTPETYAIGGDDPEVLFEQALTIDPFKTKSRLEALDTVKEQTGSFRFVRRILFGERNKTLLGLGILIGLIMAVAFFFRDSATYKSFSLLIITILLATSGQKGVLSVSTNIPLFFPRVFRKFLQRKDIRRAVRGMISWLIMLAAFAAWHYLKSYTGLAVAIIAAGYFSLIPDKFSDGRALASFSIPRPKRKSTATKNQPSVTTIPLEDAPYYSLYQVLRRNFPGKSLLSRSVGKPMLYSVLFVIAYPLVFLLVKLAGVALSYKVLVLPAVTALFLIQFPFMMSYIANLPVFFPAAARRFIPGKARRRAYLITLLELILIGSLVVWLVLDTAHVLWATGVLLFVCIRNIFRMRKTLNLDTREEATLPKQELLDYIRQHHTVFKNQAPADATQLPTAVSEADSGAQRSQ